MLEDDLVCCRRTVTDQLVRKLDECILLPCRKAELSELRLRSSQRCILCRVRNRDLRGQLGNVLSVLLLTLDGMGLVISASLCNSSLQLGLCHDLGTSTSWTVPLFMWALSTWMVLYEEFQILQPIIGLDSIAMMDNFP